MKALRLAAISALVAVTSCSDAVAPQRQIVDFEAAHQRWQAQNLHTYAFTLQRACFCANVHPLYVAVVSDTIAGVLDFETGTWVDRQLGKTVEDLFTFVQGAIDRRAARIDVAYDPARGFPTQIDYDGAVLLADDEVVYSISDVHPITPQT